MDTNKTTFTFTDDYKKDFENHVSDIIAKHLQCHVHERIFVTDNLIEDYALTTGERPESQQLERLSTFILRGFENEDPAYTFLSDRQLRRRHNDKEVVFYSPETREFHIEKEGNKYVEPKPSMDGTKSHNVWVKFDHDVGNLREFNGPLRRFFDENRIK